MHPYIIEWGIIKVSTYGIMGAIGIIFGLMVVLLKKNHYGIKRDDLLYAGCFAGIGVLVGSKLLYAITMLPKLAAITESYGFIDTVKIVLGGYVFYGGLIGGLLGGVIYARRFKLNPLELVDSYAPSIPLIHAFGRIGCFFAGCCYGMPSEKFGVLFQGLAGAPHGVKLFPIQLVESGVNFLVFAFLFIYSMKKRPVGSVCGLYLCIYAVERFILEYFRYDFNRGILFGLSTSQWISILLFPIGLAMIVISIKREKSCKSE